MTRSQLINELSKDYDQADIAVKTFFESIKDALVAGNRVELRGLGVFSPKQMDPRAGRNPKTGERIKVSAKRRPHYKMSKHVIKELNNV